MAIRKINDLAQAAGFNSPPSLQIAHLVQRTEHRTSIPGVGGSNPPVRANP